MTYLFVAFVASMLLGPPLGYIADMVLGELFMSAFYRYGLVLIRLRIPYSSEYPRATFKPELVSNTDSCTYKAIKEDKALFTFRHPIHVVKSNVVLKVPHIFRGVISCNEKGYQVTIFYPVAFILPIMVESILIACIVMVAGGLFAMVAAFIMILFNCLPILLAKGIAVREVGYCLREIAESEKSTDVSCNA